ncbi:LysR family transcriptional regulator [Paraglaciecola aestuariivivens]
MLNPTWLKTFVTLVDTGHFTQTAEKLFMTQPGVSQHINKLEQACGHKLIKRDKKSFLVSEQGHIVYHYAKTLAANENALLEQLAFDDPVAGQCSLACSGALALLLYPHLLSLQVAHPNLIIKLKAAPNRQILNEVKAGDIDQGIVTDIPNSGLFDVEQIGQEELCLVLPASADIQMPAAQLLLQTGLISHPDAEHYLSMYLVKCQTPDLQLLDMHKVPIAGFINQIGQILQPVAKGLGFTLLPRSVINSFAQPQNLQILPATKPVLENLYLVKKKQRILPARYATLNALILQHCH